MTNKENINKLKELKELSIYSSFCGSENESYYICVIENNFYVYTESFIVCTFFLKDNKINNFRWHISFDSCVVDLIIEMKKHIEHITIEKEFHNWFLKVLLEDLIEEETGEIFIIK